MKTILSAAIGAMFALSMTDACAQTKAADRKVELTIEQQSLADALNDWAKQTGLQLVSPSSEMMNTKLAPRLKGEYSPQGALEELLKGTSLTYEWVGERAVAIRAKSPIAPAALQSSGANPKGPAVPIARLSSEADARRFAATDQDNATRSEPSSSGEGATQNIESLDEVIVTGTYIRGASPTGTKVTIIDRKDLDRSGVATIDQFVQRLPSNFSQTNRETFVNRGGSLVASENTSRGGAINLRGLGPSSTLVLINGRRIAASGSSGSFVDVSMIPMSAVERIEVMADGASAIYGSDAVAGVVNFILKKNFDGAETAVSYGMPESSDSRQIRASQSLGTSWDRGSIFSTYEYYDETSLDAADRTFVPAQGGEFELIPRSERHSLFVAGHQDLGDRASLQGEFMYSRRQFEQRTLQEQIRLDDHGSAKQTGGAVALEHSLTSSWQGEISTSLSRSDEERVLNADGVPFADDTRGTTLAADYRVNGELFSTAAGSAKAAVGVGYRNENFKGRDQDLSRDITGAYAELQFPLVGPASSSSFAHRVNLSVAGRVDRYSDVGTTTNPRLGLEWAPIQDLTLRASFGTSFKAPLLPNLAPPSPRQYYVLPISDPAAANGETITLLPATPENPDIKPEKARTFSAGFDLSPDALPGLSLSMTYFNTRFKDRIQVPPVVGTVLDIYSQTDVLGPFIHRDPDTASVTEIFNTAEVLDLFGIGLGPADVQAIYDFSYQNIGVTRVSGVNLESRYAVDAAGGELAFNLSGEYLLEYSSQPTERSSSVSLVNTIFNPMDLRLRGGVSWSRGRFSSTLNLNYMDSYENNLLDPAGSVDSWLTADVQVTYSLGPVLLSLNALNVTDEDPPFVASQGAALGAGLGYDATNASALGRFVGLMLTYKSE